MKNWFDWNKQHDGWREAPWWARRLRDNLAIVTLQNEAILAQLERRESKLSPEDREAVDEIFAIEDRDRKRIDATLAKK